MTSTSARRDESFSEKLENHGPFTFALDGLPPMTDNLDVSVRHIVLSVLFFREPDDPDTWVAQALERDIAAHGKSIEQAKLAFERAVGGYLRLAVKHHKEPLAMLKPAPEPFWSAWERATGKKTVELPPADATTPAAYVIQAITDESISAIQ